MSTSQEEKEQNKKNKTKLFITGKMGSGKDAVSLWLEKYYHAQRWTRSDLMKRLSHSLIDYVDNPDQYLIRLFPDEEERNSVRDELIEYSLQYKTEAGKARRLYQDVAEICQAYDPYCFERELDQRIQLVKDVSFSLVDDVRKFSAFEYFQERGYKSLRIEADEKVRRQRILNRDGYLPSAETFNHPSETELDNVPHDYVIKNNTDDIKVLIDQLNPVLEDLGITPLPWDYKEAQIFKQQISKPKSK